MKKIIVFIFAVVGMLMFMGSIYAVPSWTITFTTPTNASTIYTVKTVINISLNVSLNDTCEYEFNNNGTWYDMDSSADNISWWNGTANPIPPLGGEQYIGYRCRNASMSWEYSNVTYSYHYYNLKDALYNINPPPTIINGSTHNVNMTINISMNDTVASCGYILDAGTPVAMTVESGRRTASNASVFEASESDFGTFHNITFYCQDAEGLDNVSWYNTSLSDLVFFRIDSVAPTISKVMWSIGNYSSGGNFFNFTFNATDNSQIGACMLRLFYENGTVGEVGEESSWNSSAQSPLCQVNITPSDVIADGKVIVQPYAIDAGFNEGSGTNITLTMMRLSAGWNLISTEEDITPGEIASEVPGITYVSVFWNDYKNKTFSTYTVGLSANRDIALDQTNATYVYASTDLVLIRWNQTAETLHNVSLWTNSSAASGWNIIGVLAVNKTMNETLHNTGCANLSVGGVGAACDNLTWASYYFPTLGRYCSGHRDRLATSCSGYTTTTLTIPKGGGLWLYTTFNLTYNRTAI